MTEPEDTGHEQPPPRNAVGESSVTGSVIQVGLVGGDIHVQSSSIPLRDRTAGVWERDVPVALPVQPSAFVGRTTELSRMAGIVRSPTSAKPSVIVVSGSAGAGKTALAIEFGHFVADDFPHGRIYLALDRRSHSRSDVDGDDALVEALVGLGLSLPEIPPDLRERARLYQTLLAGRRVLVVLDGVTDSRQVERLIPDSPTCAVVITSRTRLPRWSAGHEAVSIRLEALSTAAAVDLLIQTSRRTDPGEGADLERLAQVCRNLPLALCIVGARLIRSPATPVREMVEELLADLSPRRDRAASAVRAVFEAAYNTLPPPQASALRTLAHVPGPWFDLESAASMLDTSFDKAARLVASLSETGLLSPAAPGSRRLGFHDLLRGYTRELREADEVPQVQAALARLRSTYTRRARDAVNALTSGAAGKAQSIEWLESERANIIALAEQAADTGHEDQIQPIAEILFPFHQLRGHWTDCRTLLEIALRAARGAHDTAGCARTLNNLSVAYHEQHRFAEAQACLEESIALAKDAGTDREHGLALMNLGAAHSAAGEHEQALACFEAAIAAAGPAPEDRTTALLYASLGNALRDLSRHPEALSAYHRSLDAGRRADERHTEGITHLNRSLLYLMQGCHAEAMRDIRDSQVIARLIGDRVSEGRLLYAYGRALVQTGSSRAARGVLLECVETAGEVEDTTTVCHAYRTLGAVNAQSADLNAAQKAYASSRLAARAIGSARLEAEVVAEIAALYEQADEKQPALESWREAVRLLRRDASSPDLATALLGSGALLSALGNPDEATAAFEEAAAIGRDLDDQLLEKKALLGLSAALRELDADDEVRAARRRIAEIERIGGQRPERESAGGGE